MAKDKAGDFIRLAAKRLPAILEAIRIFGHLSNRQNYLYTPAQAAEIFRQIDGAMDEIRVEFDLTAAPPAIEMLTLVAYEPGPVETHVEYLDAKANWNAGSVDTDDFDAAIRPRTRYVEDPAYQLDDWKADPTTLGYRAWVAEQHRAMNAAVLPHVRKDFTK